MKKTAGIWKKCTNLIFLFSLISVVFIFGCSGGSDDDGSGDGTENTIDRVKTSLGTSLHGTTNGMKYFYAAENGGFEKFTNIKYDDLKCGRCHVDIEGENNGCTSCHEESGGGAVNTSDKCYACHGRQKKESTMYSDVHRDTLNMVCADCHNSAELHGDGTTYNSLLEVEAVTCEGCHDPASEQFPENPGHAIHKTDIHCASCHAQSVVSCYNCHFKSEIDHDLKLAGGVVKDCVFLMNFRGKVFPANIQTLEYDQKSFVSIAPFVSHTITSKGRKCEECHNNEAVREYAAAGSINAVWWDDTAKGFENLTGIIPVPHDYRNSLKFGFAECEKGCDSSSNAVWKHLKETADGHQMLFGTPLDKEQMEKLMK